MTLRAPHPSLLPRSAARAAERANPLPLRGEVHPAARAERRWLVAGVTGVHALGLWGLLQVDTVQHAAREASPLVIDFIAIEAPPMAPPPPPRPLELPARPAPPPVIAMALTPTAAPAPFTVPAPDPLPAPAVATVMASPAPPAPPPPSPPPAPKVLPATAVRYVVPPPIEVPMASRRLGESGIVQLRVVVDAAGLPRQVTLHRSSGHVRLDEQALGAMRQARFASQTENGAPIEWTVIAPLQYDIE